MHHWTFHTKILTWVKVTNMFIVENSVIHNRDKLGIILYKAYNVL